MNFDASRKKGMGMKTKTKSKTKSISKTKPRQALDPSKYLPNKPHTPSIHE